MRRTRNAGVNADVITSLGIPPWDTYIRGPEYVRGRYSDDGPLAALLWSDLRSAYRRHRIPHHSATMFELHLAGASTRSIARMFRLASHSTVRYHVNRVRAILEADPQLGIITVIREECGGWQAVAQFMDIDSEHN